MYSLIVMTKMNDVDPQSWLVDILVPTAEDPVQRLDGLVPRQGRKIKWLGRMHIISGQAISYPETGKSRCLRLCVSRNSLSNWADSWRGIGREGDRRERTNGL